MATGPIRLRGLTWDHPRALDPLVAATRQWSEPDVDIRWDARSLWEFGYQPLERVVRDYDLVVIDHPHVAGAAESGQLCDLDSLCDSTELAELAEQSVGPSHRSYSYAGHQWALAIDAAAQVAVYRPDELREPPRTWAEVGDLAGSGRMLWPSAGLASFLTLAAARGAPIGLGGDELIAHETGLDVLDRLHRLADSVPSWCIGAGPIEVLECLATTDHHVYAPLLFGYVNYSRPGFRQYQLKFVDMPGMDATTPAGSCLGGAGIAVSRYSRHPEVAARFAVWAAGSECQAEVYLHAGGQPGNVTAWRSQEANATTASFFADTWRTMDLAYLRPQHPRWIEFQGEGASLIAQSLRREISDRRTLDLLDTRFRRLITAH